MRGLFHWLVCLVVFVLVRAAVDAQEKSDPDKSGQRVGVLSPSVSAPSQNTTDVTNELAQPDANVTATAALLDSLDKLIPGDIQPESERETRFKLAAAEFDKANIDATFQILEDMCKADATLPPAPLLLAGMLFTYNKQAEGMGLLERTAMEYPDYPGTYSGFARIAINQNRVTDALALLEKARRKIDGGAWSDEQRDYFDVEYLDGLTDVAIRQNRLDEARQYLAQLRQRLPDNPNVPLRMAQVEFDLGDVDKSLDYLKTTKEMSPTLRAPEVILADWYFRKGDREKSAGWIEKAANDYPNDATVQLDYAKWLLRTEHFAEAAAAINKAADLGADSYTADFIKGQVAFARRTYPVAELHFSNLHQQRPGDAEVANMLALSLIESDEAAKRSRALQIAEINQRLFPDNLPILATLGWVHYRLGNNAPAEEAFRTIVANPTMPPATAFFVATYLAQSRPDAARQLLNAAIESDSYFLYRDRAQELLRSLPAETPQDPGAVPQSKGAAKKGS